MTAWVGAVDHRWWLGAVGGGEGGGIGAPGTLAGQEWMDDGACRGVGIEEFFGPHARGRRWCRRCGVAEVCFWWSTLAESDAGYHFGIWGGAIPAVRRQVLAVTGVGYCAFR